MGDRNSIDFSAGVKIDLIFVWVVDMGLFLVWGHKKWHSFRVGIEIDLISVLGSKLYWFLCGGSKFN